jgi:hypothetical protein
VIGVNSSRELGGPTRLALLILMLFCFPLRGLGAEWAQPVELDQVEITLPPLPANFQTVSGTFLRVHGAQGSTPLLLRLARRGSASIKTISTRLAVPIGGTVHVYVVESEEQFHAFQMGNAPMWADGTAYPAAGVIILKDPSIRGGQAKPLEQVLDHELAHILLGRAFLPQHPPSWLQEGVAQVVAGELGPETAETLRNGVAFGGLISLDSLARGFPQDPVRAHLAYAQSADLVAWLEETYGEEALQTIIREQVRGRPFEYAVRSATNRSMDQIEAAWRGTYESKWPVISLSALAQEEFIWGFGAVLLLVGGFLRRRQFTARLAEMAAEEQQRDAMIHKVLSDHFKDPPSSPTP